MALTEKDVRGIADYACIALTEEELADMTAYMNDAVSMLEPILQYADEDVAPTFHPIGDLSNVMRADATDADRRRRRRGRFLRNRGRERHPRRYR